MNVNKKIRLALRILSGRTDPEHLSSEEMSLLGWDWHTPRPDEIREKAEDILYDILRQPEGEQ